MTADEQHKQYTSTNCTANGYVPYIKHIIHSMGTDLTKQFSCICTAKKGYGQGYGV